MAPMHGPRLPALAAALVALAVPVGGAAQSAEGDPGVAPAGTGGAVSERDSGVGVGSPPLLIFHAPAGVPAAATARTVLVEVARRRGTTLIDLSPPVPAAPEAGAHLRQAIEAYHGFEPERAATAVEAALAEAERTGGAGLTAAELVDVHIYGALIATEQGAADLAWERFVQAAVLDPTRRLDPVRYPPRVVESFERARAELIDSPRAELQVEVDPGCALRLDARPLRARESITVVRGRHFVQVRCPGFLDYGARMLISEPVRTLRPGLVPAAPPAPAEVRGLARGRGAAAVISAVVAVSPGASPTLTLTLIEVAGGRERGRVFADLSDDSARARTDLERSVDVLVDQIMTPPAPAPVVTAAPAPTPWYRRPWVWGVAGVAVGAAALLPFLLDDRGSAGFDVHLGGEVP